MAAEAVEDLNGLLLLQIFIILKIHFISFFLAIIGDGLGSRRSRRKDVGNRGRWRRGDA